MHDPDAAAASGDEPQTAVRELLTRAVREPAARQAALGPPRSSWDPETLIEERSDGDVIRRVFECHQRGG